MKYSSEVIKKFGFRGILQIISIVSWFFLPFVVWFQVYIHFGQGYFVSTFAIPGLFLILFYAIIIVSFCMKTIGLDGKLMRHIEHARNVFDNPADPDSEYNFRRECNKFVVPYLYFPRMFLHGFVGVIGAIGIFRRVLIRILQILFHFYASYSIMVFLVINQQYFNKIWAQVSPVFPYSHEITIAIHTFLVSPILAVTLLFLLSLYSHVVISCVREGYARYSEVFWDVVYDSFSIYTRLFSILGVLLLGLPSYIKRKRSSLEYEPFTFPMSLPLIIQKSVWDIENVDCNVTKWSYIIENEKDIETLKMMIYEQEEIPSFIRYIALRADPRRALNVISKVKPVIYLGIINKRCSVLARINYDPNEKMFRGTILFDNRHVKDYFKSIAEIEIAEQKKLKQQLPTSLIDAISKLRLDNENETRR